MIRDEITEQEQREKYGYVAGDYSSDLTEEEINYMMGHSIGFSKVRQ